MLGVNISFQLLRVGYRLFSAVPHPSQEGGAQKRGVHQDGAQHLRAPALPGGAVRPGRIADDTVKDVLAVRWQLELRIGGPLSEHQCEEWRRPFCHGVSASGIAGHYRWGDILVRILLPYLISVSRVNATSRREQRLTAADLFPFSGPAHPTSLQLPAQTPAHPPASPFGRSGIPLTRQHRARAQHLSRAYSTARGFCLSQALSWVYRIQVVVGRVLVRRRGDHFLARLPYHRGVRQTYALVRGVSDERSGASLYAFCPAQLSRRSLFEWVAISRRHHPPWLPAGTKAADVAGGRVPRSFNWTLFPVTRFTTLVSCMSAGTLNSNRLFSEPFMTMNSGP